MHTCFEPNLDSFHCFYPPCLPSFCPPHRLDSLVQSQARELSQLRQQIKESRRLGALQRQQLDQLSKAFTELLQASEVDFYKGEAVKEQLEKSLSILDRLEGRLDKGSSLEKYCLSESQF